MSQMSTGRSKDSEPLSMAGDLMIGIKSIAEFLGIPERQCFWIAENQQLPIFKIGRLWAARKSTLTDHVAAQERGDGKAA